MQTNDFKLFTNKEVYFEAYATTAPTTFPATSDDIEDLPDGYEFRLGSWIYVMDTEEVYMWNGEEFALQ